MGHGSATQHDPRVPVEAFGRHLAVDADRHTVDEHMGHTHGAVGRQAFAVGRKVHDPPQRSRCDRLGVEDTDVGRLADLDACPGHRGRRRRRARP